MNRADRRRLQKENENAEKVYTMTAGQLRKIKEDATREACERAFILMIGLPLEEMRESNGWGNKRLTSLAEGILDRYKCVVEGEIELEEIMQVIEGKTGITFEFEEVQQKWIVKGKTKEKEKEKKQKQLTSGTSGIAN